MYNFDFYNPTHIVFGKDRLDELEDRKSVVQGKSVCSGVDLGGRRIIKKSFFQAEDGIRDSDP